MIVDYIEGRNDTNFDDWKPYSKSGKNTNEINSWVYNKPLKYVK
jgi:hypothetical protein